MISSWYFMGFLKIRISENAENFPIVGFPEICGYCSHATKLRDLGSETILQQ
jgi:hypothetical protein